MLRIEPRKAGDSPRTRKELLYHLWGVGIADANIVREGAWYAASTQGRIFATHCRCIGNWTFGDWERKYREAYFG